VDLADTDQVVSAFRQSRPAAVLHVAARANVADCERDPETAYGVNTAGSALLAELADAAGARLLLVSTDLVFDGERGGYWEADPPRPLSVYGRTKLQAEQAVFAFRRHAVARVSLLFGPSLTERPAFFDQQLAALRQGRSLALFEDEWRSPVSVPTAARALVALLRSDFCDLVHIGGPERMSRLEMGRRLAAFLGLDASVIAPVTRDSVPGGELRPRDTSLDSSRWRSLFPELPWPGYEDALREMGLS
jgi:dTDP-4-dehydrorhamnose reductase